MGLVAAIGTALGASAATAATVGATVIGGVVSGIGSGIMASRQAKEERKAREQQEQWRRDEEERRRASYQGLGDAARFWENGDATSGTDQGVEYQRVRAGDNAGKPVGAETDLGQKPMLGQKYRSPPAGPRYQFDKASGRIVYQ